MFMSTQLTTSTCCVRAHLYFLYKYHQGPPPHSQGFSSLYSQLIPQPEGPGIPVEESKFSLHSDLLLSQPE